MKKSLILPFSVMLLLASGCKTEPKQTGNGDSLQHELAKTDTVVQPDSTLWGHMGDGTSMNVVEFITEQGDTLYLSRTSEQTGQECEMLGEIRNNTDRFAVTTRGKAVDDGLSMRSCINVSQLMGIWKSGEEKLAFYADGSASAGSRNYKEWKVLNGHLLIKGSTKTEYGETERQDTMHILWLTEDSMALLTPQHQELKFVKNENHQGK